MQKRIAQAAVISSLIISFSVAAPSFAQSTTASSTVTATSADVSATVQAQIQTLLAQIQALQAQIAQLIQQGVQQIQQTLQLSGNLKPGMSGEEVKKLQEVLATDPTLFSSDNVTGYFGPKTEDAVRKFQSHFGIDAIGVVGPHTMEKINELLKSAKIAHTGDLHEHDLGNLDDNEDVSGANSGNAISTEAEQEHGNATSTAAREGEHGSSDGNGNATSTEHSSEGGTDN